MTEIPNAFGGFAPFPNTIMIPTMGLQSAVIGYRFGFGYEQGKRTLRAMSNEQFNTLDEEAEQAIFKRHDAAAINYFKTEMIHWVELQNLIIEKSVEIEVMKANRTPSAMREIFEGFTSGFTTQQVTDAKKFFDSIGDPIMKLIAFFSGHKGTIKSKPIDTPIITDDGKLAPPPITFPKPTVPSQGINPNISQADVSIKGLPKAGPAQIKQRNNYIANIKVSGDRVKLIKNNSNFPNAHLLIQLRAEELKLKGLITALSNYLIRYNWI